MPMIESDNATVSFPGEFLAGWDTEKKIPHRSYETAIYKVSNGCYIVHVSFHTYLYVDNDERDRDWVFVGDCSESLAWLMKFEPEYVINGIGWERPPESLLQIVRNCWAELLEILLPILAAEGEKENPLLQGR